MVGGAVFWEEAELTFTLDGVFLKEILYSFTENITE